MKVWKNEDDSLIEGLDILRVPFEAHHISKLPKPTKAQTNAVKENFKAGIRCQECDGWHHPKVIHLDYVGHAALTDRLLDADPKWNWEPMAVGENGLPLIINNELWIKLTVCGVTRNGFGDAQGKTGPNATKEMIGDALRNAGMRFGMALDLWHKGDLHIEEAASDTVEHKKDDGKARHSADIWIKEMQDAGNQEIFDNIKREAGFIKIYTECKKDFPDIYKEMTAAGKERAEELKKEK